VLTITVPLPESFDEATNTFITNGYELDLEHSLVSLSKWESRYEKPFLSKEEKTVEETLFYIRECMLLTKNPPEEIFQEFSKDNYTQIQQYINAKRTATWFNEPKDRPGPQQILTSGVIYGLMVALRIPFEPTQNWHLSELLTLIKVCNEQSKPPKKMGRGEAARQQAALNAQRQAQWGTRG